MERTLDIVKLWNECFPNYQITVDDIQKPKPMFVMEIIFEIFDVLEIDGDGIIHEKPIIEDCENMDAFSDLIPIMNLAEAVNFLQLKISTSSGRFTVSDLLSPAPFTIMMLLRLLVNFWLYVMIVRDSITDREREVRENVDKIDQLNAENEKYQHELWKLDSDNATRENRVHQLESKMKQLRMETVEVEESVRQQEGQLDALQREGRELKAELFSQHNTNAALQEELNKLRNLVVSDGEQAEVLKWLEAVQERDREASQRQQEAYQRLWDKEATVLRLTQHEALLAECKQTLDHLQGVTTRIREIERSNHPDTEALKLLAEIRAEKQELTEKIAEHHTADQQWKTEIGLANHDMQMVVDSCNSDEKKLAAECERYLVEVRECQQEVRRYQAESLKHDKRRQQIMELYVHQIPKEYEDKLEPQIERIKYIVKEFKKRMTAMSV